MWDISIEGKYVGIDFKNPVATLKQSLIMNAMNAIKYEWRKKDLACLYYLKVILPFKVLDLYSLGIHI